MITNKITKNKAKMIENNLDPSWVSLGKIC